MEPMTAQHWRKSSYSANGGQNCVEAGSAPGRVLVRDTKLGEASSVLTCDASAWNAFTLSLK